TMRTKAPVFGETGILLGLACSTWPYKNTADTFDLKTDPDTPIVVIGTTGDPATPVQWARNTAKNLGNGVFVEFQGEGHTIYGQGNQCVDSLVNGYFISGKEPNSKKCS